MERGDIIEVRMYHDRTDRRVVWQVEEGWVMACRPEVYAETVERGQEEPESWMGFPKEDVLTVTPKGMAA
jgi:hypothetical protein